MSQPAGLISVLLDRSADVASRDDAAMDLGAFDQSEVESALLLVASSPDTPAVVCASSGESLAQIWVRRGSIKMQCYRNLCQPAKAEVESYINAISPSLLNS